MTISIKLGKVKPLALAEGESDPGSTLTQRSEDALLVRASRWLATCMQQISRLRVPGRPSRRLRLAETLSLGEKRFVAIVEVDGVPLLVGGSSTGVVLLKELGQPSAASTNPFAHALDEARYREGNAWLPQ